MIVGFYFAEDKLIHRSFDLATNEYSSTDDQQKALAGGRSSIAKAAEIIQKNYDNKLLRGIGLAVPTSIVELDRQSASYGSLGNQLTPRGWTGFNAVDSLSQLLSDSSFKFGVPKAIGVISQVGAAAKGHFFSSLDDDKRKAAADPEFTCRAQHERTYLYIVADHGIGVASYNAGWLLHGTSVPNIGHSLVVPFDGVIPMRCEVHPQRTCLNSFASLDAIYHRWPHVKELKNGFKDCRDENIISIVAHYIAQATSNLVLYMSPQQIIIGGRIAENPLFLKHFKSNLQALLEHSSPFTEVSNRFLNKVDNLVKSQDDPHYGVNGAILTALEHFRSDQKRQQSEDSSNAT